MNAPERTANFTLDEDAGEQKIVYSADTKVRQNPSIGRGGDLKKETDRDLFPSS